MAEKIVVYTAIFGRIQDCLHLPRNIPDDVELHAFVDSSRFIAGDKPRLQGWRLRQPFWSEPTDHRRLARRHKLNPEEIFPDADCTLWLDGCLTPVHNPKTLVEEYLLDYDVCSFKHAEHGCLFKELELCLRLNKDKPRIMREQVKRYRDEGYPHDNGQTETTALLRRHTNKVREFNAMWWNEVKSSSLRDQLSVDYVAWKLGVEINHFQGVRFQSPHFQWRAHR